MRSCAVGGSLRTPALPKSVGAEPKKLALLGAILFGRSRFYWMQHRSDAGQTVAASTKHLW